MPMNKNKLEMNLYEFMWNNVNSYKIIYNYIQLFCVIILAMYDYAPHTLKVWGVTVIYPWTHHPGHGNIGGWWVY